MTKKKIRKRDRDAIIQSLRAGVTPTKGLQYIQVGRVKEVQALIKDLDRIADGGSAFRLIIGEFGAGKTFFLHLVKTIALEKNLVVASADLSPDRRLYASKGQARSLYRELMKNLSTKTRPDGNALVSVVEKFISRARAEASECDKPVKSIISGRLKALTNYVGGYDFASIIDAYWEGYNSDDEEAKSSAIQWLRAEFATRTDARKALGVRTIIDDNNAYDHLKLMSLFLRQAGYSGFLVNLDEMVNLYKLSHTKARSSNYEQILRILNDCLQGTISYFGVLMGGTPEFLLDTRKGLYSYEALQSRLSENTFSKSSGIVDYDSPSLHLNNLRPEDLFLLLQNIRDVFAYYDESKYLISDEGIKAFMMHCDKRIGSAYFKTPRNSIKAFSDLLSLLDQNPDISWDSIIQDVKIKHEKNTESLTLLEAESVDDDELTSFKL
ncbi:ATP-binding protein [Candidatus Bathyarchaeota archaeon]|nr:ATP-binding protein [Candidatus Bathyarchaeota archaeon]